MKKIAIIYYSASGNTQQMAEEILNSAKAANADATLFNVSDITAQEALNYDVLVLGCSAKGVEELEEAEFEPFFAELEANLANKTVALFGSYGWGGGEWMRTWEGRVKTAGGNLIHEGTICLEAPDDEALEACKKLGEEVASI